MKTGIPSLTILAVILGGGWAQSAPRTAFPDFETLTCGGQQVWLLPGSRGFVFSLYGAPGELDKIQQLVGVMRAQNLGNGFDPGPTPQPNTKPIFDYLATVGWPVICYPGGDMQIKGGRGVLGLLLPQPVPHGILVAR
jgi:hypothetical protein